MINGLPYLYDQKKIEVSQQLLRGPTRALDNCKTNKIVENATTSLEKISPPLRV